MNAFCIAICKSNDGDYIREQCLGVGGLSQMVTEIYSGEIEDVRSVLEIDPAKGTCRDVTKEAAEMIAARSHHEERELFPDLLEWVEFHGADPYRDPPTPEDRAFERADYLNKLSREAAE